MYIYIYIHICISCRTPWYDDIMQHAPIMIMAVITLHLMKTHNEVSHNVTTHDNTQPTIAIQTKERPVRALTDAVGFEMFDISAQVSGGFKFYGGVLTQSGKVVMTPRDATGIGVFDPAEHSFEFIDIPAQLSGPEFHGAAATQSGKIVMTPTFYANSIGVFDPTDDSFELIGTVGASFCGAALAQNGKIVMAPSSIASIGVFDPTDNSFQLIDTGSAHDFCGATTAPNGKIVMPPRSSGSIGVFDPADNSFELIDISAQVITVIVIVI